MMLLLRPIPLLFVLFFLPCLVQAQQRMLAGLNFSTEIYPELTQAVVGASIEKNFSARSGMETGIYFRNQRFNSTITIMDSSWHRTYEVTVLQRHLVIPLLYKYYGRRINFSIGPRIDWFVGWKQKNIQSAESTLLAYDVDPEIRIGLLGKIGKFIPLRDNILLEPFLHIGSKGLLYDFRVGAGIGAKYRL